MLALSGAADPGRNPGNAGDAELIWPDDPRAVAALAYEALSAPARPSSAWPRTIGEICAPARGNPAAPGSAAALETLRRACGEGSGTLPPVSVTFHAGAEGLGKTAPLGQVFERFGGNWYSLRTDAEQARAWTRMPALADVELRHGFTPRAFAYFRFGLRRDLAAWHEDDLSLNVPLSPQEVDLNEPSLGYFRYEGRFAGITVGRFPAHWSPSPEFGLTLSESVPRHDGLDLALKAPRLTYRFLVSSLNPWLEGTPPGGSSSEDYPVGSEEWRQRHYPDIGGSGNAHRRVYDARIKTLVAHRLETWAGPAVLGISETNIIGGKVPDFRDINPFAVFHNDFRDGYSNNGMSFDASIRLPRGWSVAAEVFVDDLEYSATEGAGGTPSLLGWMGALRHSFRLRGWTVTQSAHAVWTDPFLYGFLQPLNAYSSRQVLTTNYPGQDEPFFYDKLVVDYPIGYLRGGDALDFWYRLRALGESSRRVELSAAWLAKGPVDLATPFEEYYAPHGSAPSGVPEEELRLSLSGQAAVGRGFLLDGGAGWSLIRNRNHVDGESDQDFRFAAGCTWGFAIGTRRP